MKSAIFAVMAAVCLLLSTAPASSKPQFQSGGVVNCDQRYPHTCDVRGFKKARAAKSRQSFRSERRAGPRRGIHRSAGHVHRQRAASATKQPAQRLARQAGAQAPARLQGHVSEILPHPAGCPRRAFCGCGAALKVFGRAITRGTFAVAAYWLRLPPAAPAPGMVAARRGHVFVIEEMTGLKDRRGHPIVIAYDANSGRHLTRRHARSLAGYSVRNPHGST
jgi:hypothetical protein